MGASAPESAPSPSSFGPALSGNDVPLAVRAPLGQSLFLEALANGVQTYECRSLRVNYGWVFQAPEALLADRGGKPLGKHSAGPTWESVDGSSVVGELRASDPGPTPSAIPWLLLSVKGTTGSGVLTQTKSIQRLSTVGGAAPTEPCDASKSGQVMRVPYQAVYNFYRVSP